MSELPERTEPRGPRQLPSLVPAELGAVLVLAAAPLPDVVPIALPLLVLGSVSRWVRGRSWGELFGGGWAGLIAGAAGLVAVLLSVAVGTPFVEQMSGRAVEWAAFPVIRGSADQAVLIGLVVIALAVASELALRGWIVERVLELSPGPPILPILVGAAAEALVTPGDAAVRIGAGVFGLGLGWLYVSAGRRVLAPICARIGFGLGAVVLEALRVIG